MLKVTDPTQMPNLLYLADVPVEASYHGSALIYRLLQSYPPERLLILEAAPWRSRKDRRLNDVTYRPFPLGWGRLLNSRLARWYGSWVLRRAPNRWRRVVDAAGNFRPTAVLTVTHGYSWLSASEYALHLNLPLHLILHDDWLTSVVALKTSRSVSARMFARYYRYATTRSCVSPGMAERYQADYGAQGEVLYPIRAHDAPVATGPVMSARSDSFVVGYAGTINGEGYVRLLKSMAAALRKINGTLLIYGPTTKERANELGLDSDNIILRGLVPSQELIARLREEADILFVPMSFRHEDRINMELSFPSKLTDYTAVGLPLLINGPLYCSAIRWARQEPGVAEIVASEKDSELAEALVRIIEDPAHRQRLSQKAIEIGDKYFSHRRAVTTFVGGLTGQVAEKPS
jgi:glycosyltransferase involved in cell wall biosynthesis